MAVIFRKPLVRILSSRPVKTLEAGPKGLKVEFFDEKLAEARTELEEAATPEVPSPPSPATPPVSTDFVTEMQQLAEVAPTAVVLESFARLERVLRDAVDKVDGDGQKPTRPVSVRALARRAVELGLMSAPELSAFDDVAVLRNVIAHGGTTELDKGRALAYADVVRQLIISLSIGNGRTAIDGPIG
jgi:hypothetical protein